MNDGQGRAGSTLCVAVDVEGSHSSRPVSGFKGADGGREMVGSSLTVRSHPRLRCPPVIRVCKVSFSFAETVPKRANHYCNVTYFENHISLVTMRHVQTRCTKSISEHKTVQWNYLTLLDNRNSNCEQGVRTVVVSPMSTSHLRCMQCNLDNRIFFFTAVEG